jgi:hypothetical protein
LGKVYSASIANFNQTVDTLELLQVQASSLENDEIVRLLRIEIAKTDAIGDTNEKMNRLVLSRDTTRGTGINVDMFPVEDGSDPEQTHEGLVSAVPGSPRLQEFGWNRRSPIVRQYPADRAPIVGRGTNDFINILQDVNGQTGNSYYVTVWISKNVTPDASPGVYRQRQRIDYYHKAVPFFFSAGVAPPTEILQDPIYRGMTPTPR